MTVELTVWMWAFALTIVCAACAAEAGPQPGLLEAELIYGTPPPPRCHASTIAEAAGGLVAAWFGGTGEGHADVGIWLARHDGKAWSTPIEVASGIQPDGTRHPCWNPVLFQPKATKRGVETPRPNERGMGTSRPNERGMETSRPNERGMETSRLQLFYKVGPSPRTWWGVLITSADGGTTWSKPQRLPDGFLGPVKNKPIQLPDGAILCGSSTEHDGWRVHFERTPDLGTTWQRIGPIHDGKAFGAIQPTLLVHPGNTLQVLCRTKQCRISESWSADGGKTWSKMADAGLPNPNSGIDAVTLADGRHLLVYNPVGRLKLLGRWIRPRTPLCVAVSADGKAWQAALVLETMVGEFSYPAVIQSADGLVHITYTWQRLRIKHVVVDPAKLVLRPMPDGKWPE